MPQRPAALDEWAARRRARGTVSTEPLTPVAHGASQDVSPPVVPAHPDGASITAAPMFTSVPTVPRLDFAGGSLLSLGVDGLLETSQ